MKGQPTGAAAATTQHGVFSFLLAEAGHYAVLGACALVENPAVFTQFECFQLPVGLAIYGHGRASKRFVDWLATMTSPDFQLLHLPDYDPVGLTEFERLRSRLGNRVRLHLPHDLDQQFACFSNQALLKNANSQSMLANLRSSDCPEVRHVVALIDLPKRRLGAGGAPAETTHPNFSMTGAGRPICLSKSFVTVFSSTQSVRRLHRPLGVAFFGATLRFTAHYFMAPASTDGCTDWVDVNPGSIVQCRSREWVLLPSDQDDLLLLRPLTGATDEIVAVHKRLTDLIGYSFPEERVRSAKFPPPKSDDISNAAGAHLLWQAARLTLREGATPLRSLGRVSIRPRTYQFVPLLMALRLDTIRMLIADDVGVGKTIEGLLIVRELLIAEKSKASA